MSNSNINLSWQPTNDKFKIIVQYVHFQKKKHIHDIILYHDTYDYKAHSFQGNLWCFVMFHKTPASVNMRISHEIPGRKFQEVCSKYLIS